MNRLILIGNGFDLAHNLKTGYKDFINWYWTKWYEKLRSSEKSYEDDELCSFKLKLQHILWYIHLSQHIDLSERQLSGIEFINQIINESPETYELIKCPLLENITQSIETKGWVDIENEYYHLLTEYTKETYQEEDVKKLNKQLEFLRKRLIEYLKEINSEDKKCYDNIAEKIYAPFKEQDFSLFGVKCLDEHKKTVMSQNELLWRGKLFCYRIDNQNCSRIIDMAETAKKNPDLYNLDDYSFLFMLPDEIMILSFN
jgi:hypothetical protein